VQLTIDRIDRVSGLGTDERAARRSLRAQIARLERQLSGIVANGFPHIAPPGHASARASAPARRSGGAPCLLNLEQLERTRDELAGRVQLAQRATAERVELETSSRELLERMKREPARYKLVRLPVRDLGQGGCGVWEVRPRLGLIGMLAGWWQVKLSSGCPLAGGHAAAWPGEHTIGGLRRYPEGRGAALAPRRVARRFALGVRFPRRASPRSPADHTATQGPRSGVSRRSRSE
jgi:hypothetical protein